MRRVVEINAKTIEIKNVKSGSDERTTCVLSVEEYLKGIRSLSCANGDEIGIDFLEKEIIDETLDTIIQYDKKGFVEKKI